MTSGNEQMCHTRNGSHIK